MLTGEYVSWIEKKALEKMREEILKVHAKNIKVASNVDFKQIARMASGASGAELANIINEAALRAVRDGRKFAE